MKAVYIAWAACCSFRLLCRILADAQQCSKREGQCAGYRGDVRKAVHVRGFCWLISKATTATWSVHYDNAGTHYATPSRGQLAVLNDATVRAEVYAAIMAEPAGVDPGIIYLGGWRRGNLTTQTVMQESRKFDDFWWVSQADGVELPMDGAELRATRSALPWETNYHYIELHSVDGGLDNCHETWPAPGLFQYRAPFGCVRFTRVAGRWEGVGSVLSERPVTPGGALRCQLDCARSMLCYAFTALDGGAVCRLHYEIGNVLRGKVANETAALFVVDY